MESIHKFIIELHVLQCLFVRGPDKKQWRGRIISNFTKGETSAVGDNLSVIPLFAPSIQERSFFPLQFGQEENISGNSTEWRTY